MLGELVISSPSKCWVQHAKDVLKVPCRLIFVPLINTFSAHHLKILDNDEQVVEVFAEETVKAADTDKRERN